MEEMSISAYDVEVMRHREAEKVRKHERAIKRWVAVGSTGIALAVAAGVIGVAYIFWQGVAGPSADDQEETKVRIACTEAGGTWIKVSTPGESASDYGTCFNTKADG